MAITFSGTSQYYLTTTTPVTGAPLTYATWGNVGIDGNVVAMAIGGSGGSTEALVLRHNATTRGVSMRAESTVGGTDQSVTGTMVTGTWGHMCGTSSASNNRIAYFNGAAGTANTQTNAPASLDRVGIGSVADSSPAQGEWNGDLFWVAIWDVALTAAQVQNLADGFSPLTVQRQNLVFFARCEYPGPVDMIGYRTLAATGTPTVSANPNGVMRVLPRGRGRARLRVSA